MGLRKDTWLPAALGLTDGARPFPWQEDLLARFLAGDVPRALDIPTGLGKTAVMAIWLVARACGADVPRRLVYVVDRRAVVDQASDVALGLRELVGSDEQLADRLGLTRPLAISTLRGQFVDNREWLADPASPSIVIGTVDMIGSRLLFEGYGVSRKMRPFHAGLLGVDTLVTLDEAHLVPPFEHLLRTVATDRTLHPRGPRHELPRAFELLALSATGGAHTTDALRLSERDHADQAVRKRLDAKKSIRLDRIDEATGLAETLARRAWALADNGRRPARVLVYSHSPDVAKKASDALAKLAKGDRRATAGAVTPDTELFVGARRVFERGEAKRRLSRLGFLAGSDVARTSPTFLIATSAGEVGVDLDADHMVCDLVAWERMVQRLGRVNRRGKGDAEVIVVLDPEPTNVEALLNQDGNRRSSKDEATVVSVLLARAVRSVIERLPGVRGGRDASPGALHTLRHEADADPELASLMAAATTPEPLRPALTRALVDAWAMTSLETHTGRPAIQPWLRGWLSDDPQTKVVWRAHLPVRSHGATPSKQEIESFFEAAPPHTSEVLETETYRVVGWLVTRAVSVAQAEDAADAKAPHLREDETVAFVLNDDGGLRRSFNLSQLAAPETKRELERALAAATLIVDRRLSGLRDGLLDDKHDDLPVTADADGGESWLGEGVVGFRITDAATPTSTSQWRQRYRFRAEVSEEGEVGRWLLVEKWRDDAATEDDRSSASLQLLDEHESWAEQRAGRLAATLDLDSELSRVLTLAARIHDEGKRAERWQRAFNAPGGDVFAKTVGPIRYGVLDGYRHELGSVLRAETNEDVMALSKESRDLLLHLIAAHHGFARPVIRTDACEDGPPSVLEHKAAEIALRFARLHARWGPWGLAWLEALLRAADQQASRDVAWGDG